MSASKVNATRLPDRGPWSTTGARVPTRVAPGTAETVATVGVGTVCGTAGPADVATGLPGGTAGLAEVAAGPAGGTAAEVEEPTKTG
ncbi:hypothetical protein ACLQ24_24305 [Micromonospora sp. DT4]|uniref:hypothetical protein n=1 Tax=Micromonospora sp. DT4 TaxID=3393438 RepID=UPI003CF62F76